MSSKQLRKFIVYRNFTQTLDTRFRFQREKGQGGLAAFSLPVFLPVQIHFLRILLHSLIPILERIPEDHISYYLSKIHFKKLKTFIV